MIWFEYKYITYLEVVKKMKIIIDYSIIEIIILLISVFLILWFILYIIPIINVYLENNKLIKEKNKKKNLLKKISLQRNIEDKIAKEINI